MKGQNMIDVNVVPQSKEDLLSMLTSANPQIRKASVAMRLLMEFESFMGERQVEIPQGAIEGEVNGMLSDFGASLIGLYNREAEELEEPLTPREKQVLALLKKGKTNQQIARQLTISPGTARNYVVALCQKLGCVSRTEVVAYAMQHGF